MPESVREETRSSNRGKVQREEDDQKTVQLECPFCEVRTSVKVGEAKQQGARCVSDGINLLYAE